jgi:hypothetical protein
LKPGPNALTFRIGDDTGTAQTITITFSSGAAPSPVPSVTAAPTLRPTAIPTVAPTPKPTPTPAPVVYAKLSARGWALIVKNPDAYIGKTYQVWGCIWQFDAATGPDDFLAQASYTQLTYWFSDGDNATFGVLGAPSLDNFIENDVVVMNVMVLGSYSYDTQSGGNTTVPSFLIERITRKGAC